MSHIPQQTALYAGSEVRHFNLLDTVHRPTYELRNLDEASLACLAIHDDHHEVVSAASTSEGDSEARPR